MKALPVKETVVDGRTAYTMVDPKEASHVWLSFPGPIYHRLLPVLLGNQTRAGTGKWSWNGDTEKPTLKPSILTKSRDDKGEVVCHSFVNDGMVQFLGDCTHELKGKTVPLLDIDWDTRRDPPTKCGS